MPALAAQGWGPEWQPLGAAMGAAAVPALAAKAWGAERRVLGAAMAAVVAPQALWASAQPCKHGGAMNTLQGLRSRSNARLA